MGAGAESRISKEQEVTWGWPTVTTVAAPELA